MPNGFLFRKIITERHNFLIEGVKYNPNILGVELFYYFFIGLSKYGGGGLSDIVFFKRLGAGFQSNEVIFNVFMISKNRDGGLKVVLKLHRKVVGLGIEGKDKECSKIIKVRLYKYFIGLECFNPRHYYNIQNKHIFRLKYSCI